MERNLDNDSEYSRLAIKWALLCNPVGLSVSAACVTNAYTPDISVGIDFMYLYFAGIISSIFYITALHKQDVYALEGLTNERMCVRVAYYLSLWGFQLVTSLFMFGTVFGLIELERIIG